LRQTYTNWELLILDDGSTDDSLDIARRFEDHRIQVFAAKDFYGFASQLNRAVGLAKGAYFARMDADDVAHPQRLEKQVTFLESHPDIDLLGTAIRLINSQNQAVGATLFPVNHAEIIDKPWLRTLAMAHPTWCGRIDWFRRWPYRDFIRNEDQELLLRAAKSSKYANLPEVLLDYAMPYSLKKSFLARWNWGRVLWVHYGSRGAILLFLAGVGILIVKIFLDFIRYIRSSL
jgi:glycosyltransferase involved in cell wall biosynthesis